MAFTLPNLENHGGSGAGVKIWSYKSDDAIATVEGTGYFNDAAGLLSVGDLIWCYLSDKQQFKSVTAISAGVVTVADIVLT